MKRNKPIRDTIQLTKKNWKKLGLILVWDILFILLLVNLRFVSANFNGWVFTQLSGSSQVMDIIAVLSLFTTESLLSIAIYSFFKFLILGNVQGIFKKTELKFNRFFSFIKLNWIIGVPVFFIYLFLYILIMSYLGNTISEGIDNPISLLFNLFIILVTVLITLIYFYTLINIAHHIFLKEKSMKKTLKHTFINSFRIRSYKSYWSNLKIIFISLIILLVFYGFMKMFVLTSVSAYLRYGGIHKMGSTTIIILTGYFLLLFNRINFYSEIVDREK